jgi:tetratricopeptide (TPR) repeat protein
MEIAMRRILWIGLFTATMWAGGCGQTSTQGVKLLDQAYAAYQNQDDPTVIRAANEFMQSDGRSTRADEALYLRGLARYRSKDVAGAKSDLTEAAARTKWLKAQAHLALGDLAWDSDDMNEAEAMFTKSLAEMETTGDTRPAPNQDKSLADRSHAQYRLGCVFQRQGKWLEADEKFDRVIYEDKDSRLARQAALRTHCRAWTVRACTLSRSDGAPNAIARLKANGIPDAYVQPTQIDSTLKYVVQVGKYPTYDQANAILHKVREIYGDAYLSPTAP